MCAKTKSKQESGIARGEEIRKLKKAATAGCNGSFLPGVVRAGKEERWLVSLYAPTAQHPRQRWHRSDLLYEYCGLTVDVAGRVSSCHTCRSFTRQFAYFFQSNDRTHGSAMLLSRHFYHFALGFYSQMARRLGHRISICQFTGCTTLTIALSSREMKVSVARFVKSFRIVFQSNISNDENTRVGSANSAKFTIRERNRGEDAGGKRKWLPAEDETEKKRRGRRGSFPIVQF